MNLVRAELDRLSARRFVQVMIALLLAALTITIATTLAGSHEPTAAELASAQARAEELRGEFVEGYEECQAYWRSDQRAELDPRWPADCGSLLRDVAEPADFLAGVFVYERQVEGLTYLLFAFLGLFGFVIGASYVGAELTSGGMTNLLLWRPQRMLVLGTKLGTLVAAVLLLSVVVTVGYLGAFRLIAQVRGLPGTLDGAFWGGLALTVGRGLGLTALVTALGFAIATLGRHTAAALGVVVSYVIAWEGGARVVMTIIETARADRWMLSSYVVAWMLGEYEVWDGSACPGGVSVPAYCDGSYTIGGGSALVVLLLLVGVSVGGAFASFRGRDLS